LTARFEKRRVDALELPADEWDKLAAGASPAVRSALEHAARRVRAFHERERHPSFEIVEGGIRVGSRVDPLARVGIYVPGGTARYPSTVIMTAVPARVAGVREIVMTTTGPSPETLLAARIAGVARVFVAGPTELVIGADDSVDPSWIAADLLAQAEHDELAVPILVARGAEVARRVAAEVARQVALLPRRVIAERALAEQGAIFVVENDDEMADVINQLAPEHAELAIRDARGLAARITTAGALFLGAFTPEPVGDYIAGPSHVLPTGGSARFAGPLGVADFVKRTSIIEYDAAALSGQSDDITALTAVEGLDAHGRAVRIRTRS
jgi:histidinol dehydrogenase